MQIAICDDNAKDRKRIHDFIKKAELFQLGDTEERLLITEFGDGESLIQAFHQGRRFHMVLLDVQMKKIDGFDTAGVIRELDRRVMIAFITSWAEYVTKALFVEASAYIVKPVKEKDVQSLLMRAIKRQESQEQNAIILHLSQCIQKLAPSDILYVETNANRRVRFVRFTGESLFAYKKMAEAKNELKAHGFIDVSRAAIVNPLYIDCFYKDKKTIRMINGDEIVVNKKDWDVVCGEYMTYLSEKAHSKLKQTNDLE